MGFDFNKVIEDAAKSLGVMSDEIKPKLEELGDKFHERFGDDMDAAKESLMRVGKELLGSKESDMDPIEIVDKVLNREDPTSRITAKVSDAKEAAEDAAETAKEAAVNAGESVKATATDAAGKAEDALEDIVDTIKDKAEDVGGMLGNIFKGVGDKIKDALDGDDKHGSAK